MLRKSIKVILKQFEPSIWEVFSSKYPCLFRWISPHLERALKDVSALLRYSIFTVYYVWNKDGTMQIAR